MSSRIIRHREWKTSVNYTLRFDLLDVPGAGYSFDCGETGVVNEERLNPQGRENLAKCRAGLVNVGAGYLERREHDYAVPALLRCDCGRKLELSSGWANSCRCGAEYNGSGQLLAPRSQWGWETGETF